MQISHIRAQLAGQKYEFCVTFDDGNEVPVSAHDLHSYQRFQRAVLSQTGQKYALYLITQARARDRAEVWAGEIRLLLYTSTSAEDATL